MTDREELESMCKRRGFIWQSAEIYGGEAGFYDYGHLGAGLLDNWKREWKDFFLGLDENYHTIHTPNIHPYRVLEASGHVDHFSDVMVRCQRCGSSFRGDQLVEEETGENAEWMGKEDIGDKLEELNLSCPDCGGTFSEPEDFNMMFEVDLGPTGERKGFLRPETAQTAYLNFRREYRALRKKMPLGLATIGPAFRNEISPRKGVYRMREFQQAELQIFFVPEIHENVFNRKFEKIKDMKVRIKRAAEEKTKETKLENIADIPPFYLYHLGEMYRFTSEVMDLDPENIRFRELSEEEKAFYNKIHFDLEVDFETIGGWKEISGLHYRSDHDLKQHQDGSNTKLSVPTDDGRKIPHVIELSFGIDRNIWALLDKGYHPGDDRAWLDLPGKLTPRQVAIFPLVRKDGLPEKSREVYDRLKEDFRVHWEKSGSIGKRYARNDEVGTRYCITVDYDTLEDDTVTIRDVKSTEQIRVSINESSEILRSLLEGEEKFQDHLDT
ncbi:MAG: glycine--tRNA ligase [Candidatus Thermoplasmatota archaeon]